MIAASSDQLQIVRTLCRAPIAWLVASVCCATVPAQVSAQAGATRVELGSVEEVIVTAQKRSERLEDVPIIISVLDGKELDQSTLTGIHEVLSREPGMAVGLDGFTNGVRLALRGVTAAGGAFSGASPIAYYLDSIPFGFVRTAYVPDMGAYDLDRIEVLRGPQGTLYGAGGLGGVVRVLTKDPDLSDYEFKTRAALSSVQDGSAGYRSDVAVNIPIVQDRLAMRVVAGYEQIPGWVDQTGYTVSTFPVSGTNGPAGEKDANEGDQRNLRLKLRGELTDQLSLGLSVWNTRTRYGAPLLGDDTNRTPAMHSEPMTTELDAYSFKIDYAAPAFSLSSMSSYLDYSAASSLIAFSDFFGGGASFDTYLWSEVYSQELVLTSQQEGSWRWSAGVFYRNAKDRTDQYTGPRFTYFSDFSEQSAVFGDVGRRFWNDKLEWTLGLRYFYDKVATKSNDNTIPSQADLPLTRIGDSFHATSPRVALTWHPAANLTVYGSYGEGFRSGAPQSPLALNTAPEFPAAKPDTLRNYEIGAKGALLDGRVSFETALYYIDWEDTQQSLSVPLPGNEAVGVLVLANSESVSGLGLDVVLTARPVEGLELGFSYSQNDLTFDQDVFSGGSILFSKGDRLANSPEYTVNPFVTYTFPFGASGYSGRFLADASYISPTNTKKLGDPNGLDGDAIKIARSGFAIEAPKRWSVSLSVDNLTNYQGTPVPGVSTDALRFYTQRVRPRTFNLQFEYLMKK
jgi:outer membrane receptor protein involved in Fe transport